MSYTKTTWVNNTTPIDENNLNKIEQGIYDNSLITEAIADKLNPTDTETYKTAELTEGQITDVIGVNDIVIKGQTEQDGTPTPSAPVDVNVVSGSNVINTSNKNLFNKDTVVNKSLYSGSVGQVISIGTNSNTFRCPIFKKISDKITISANDTSATMRVLLLDKDYKILSTTAYTTLPRTIDTSNCEFIAIFFDGTTITINNNIQIEQNSTATTYEPHQGKELPLDLPVENLFKLEDASSLYLGVNYSISKSELLLDGTTNGADKYIYNNTSNYITLKAGTYTISSYKLEGSYKYTGDIAINLRNVDNKTIYMAISKNTNYTQSQVITLTEDTNICLQIYTNASGNILNNLKIGFQIEKGSKVNAYTPYGTDPIELCKIGDYQDYFYKSGSKWYLHKEVGKRVLDGSESDFSAVGSSGSYYRISLLNVNNIKNFGSQRTTNIFINNFSKSTVDNYNSVFQYEDDIYFYLPEGMSTKQAFVDLLGSTNSVLYYVLNNTTNTEITDTTLKSQLEVIYNAPLYEQTIITQTNNDLPMILDITACKDNINGIKAFIRK